MCLFSGTLTQAGVFTSLGLSYPACKVGYVTTSPSYRRPKKLAAHTGADGRDGAWPLSPPGPTPRPASSQWRAGGTLVSRRARAAPGRHAMSAGWFRRRFLPGGPFPEPRPAGPRSSPVPYHRPRFLRGSGSSPGATDASRRPDARPVRSPARGRTLPWNAGYAE